MAETRKTLQNTSFMMSGAECAAFIVANRNKIASCFIGRSENKEAAIPEVVCKCLGVEDGSGLKLKLRDGSCSFGATRSRRSGVAM